MPVATVQLPERCYAMDVVYPLMVVGTAERHMQIYNLTNPTVPYKVRYYHTCCPGFRFIFVTQLFD